MPVKVKKGKGPEGAPLGAAVGLLVGYVLGSGIQIYLQCHPGKDSKAGLYPAFEGSNPSGGSTPSKPPILEFKDNGKTIFTVPERPRICIPGPGPQEIMESDFDDTVDKWLSEKAKEHAVGEQLLRAIMIVESRGNPKALSPAGAIGLMQLMPATAREMGVDPRDPHQNIDGGARYLSFLLQLFKGNLSLTLAGWNAGPGAVLEWGGVPPYPETQHFIRKVKVAKQVLESE